MDNIDRAAESWRDTIEGERFEAIAWYIRFESSYRTVRLFPSKQSGSLFQLV